MPGTKTAMQQTDVLYLSHLKKGDSASVVGMVGGIGEEQQAMQRRLLELGFIAGEQIRIVAESFPGRDPIAVRVGNSTFALRRHEAAMIQVLPARKVAAA